MDESFPVSVHHAITILTHLLFSTVDSNGEKKI